MMIHIPLFLRQSRSLWRTCCNTTETTCAAAACKYVSKILCKSQKVLHIPKCSTTRALDLCYHVVSMSNNNLQWTLQTYCMQKIDFSPHCIKFFVTKRCLETKHSLLYMFDCCQTTVPKIKIAFICPIVAVQDLMCQVKCHWWKSPA